MTAITGRLMRFGPEVKTQAAGALWGRVAEKLDEAAGVKITRVLAGSAAEATGLQVGDRMLTIDGRWTDTMGDTFDALAAIKPGQAVSVVIWRAGQKKEGTVTPRAGL